MRSDAEVKVMTTYVALIHKDADSDYGVSFPDLLGCVSAGLTINEAIANAREALSLHIEGMLEDGEDIPIPTAADAINREDALLIAAIDVPDNLKVERVNITVPAITLARIDSFAEQRGMTRSALLVEAVQRWIAEEHAALNRPPRPRIAASVGRAVSRQRAGRDLPETANYLKDLETKYLRGLRASYLERMAEAPTEAALSARQDALIIEEDEEQTAANALIEEDEKHVAAKTEKPEIDDIVESIRHLLEQSAKRQAG